MTRLAKCNQITAIVCTTFTQRLLMMNLFCRHDDPTGKTQLTERMLCSIFITDPFPCSTVSLLGSFIPSILLIVMIYCALMLRAISPIGQIWTARVSTRLLWTLRHIYHHPSKKPPQISPQWLLPSFIFAILTISHLWTVILWILL